MATRSTGGKRIRLLATLITTLAFHPGLHLGPSESHRATFYSVPPCDRQGTHTASGQHVHFGVIASNFLPLGTRLRFSRPLFGRRNFQVLDTGAPFDIWLPCGPWTRGWNNPTITYRVIR